MKLQKNNEEKSQVMGATMAKEFTIDTSNQMIVSILRDKLYANKIAAVCREVASNSRDANREAGRGDVPVIITISEADSLLSNEGLQISFKDSGIGISPDRIENVFLKYGSSTKRNTNNQTGGFGIGAKTPFAYAKEFLVSTVSEHEGKLMKHIYQAIILNNNGLESSQLILVSDEVTNEPTGTEIIVPIDVKDREDFEKECVKATTLWEVQPKFVGFNKGHIKIKTLKKGTDWKLVEGNYNSELFGADHYMFFLEVDGIPYKLKLDEISNSNPNKDVLRGKIYRMSDRYNYSGYNVNPILIFKTGELTLSASREDVETTNENVAVISQKYKKMLDELIEEGRKEYKKLTTKIDKISFYNNIKNRGENSLELFYNKFNLGSELENEFVELKTLPKSYMTLADKKATFYSFGVNDTYSTTKKNEASDTLIRKENMSKTLFVFRSPLERSNYRKNITLKSVAKELNKTQIVMVVGKPYHLTEEVEKAKTAISNMKDVLDESNLSYVNYEEIESAKIESSNKEKRPVDKERGTISGRELVGSYRDYNNRYGCLTTDKISFKYFKKTKQVEFESYFKDMDSFDKNKMVIIPLSTFSDLKDIDIRNPSWHTCTKHLLNDVTLGDEVVSGTFILDILFKFGFKIWIVSKVKFDLIDKTDCVLGLANAWKKLTKDKKFIADCSEVKNVEDIEDFEGVSPDTDYHDTYIKEVCGRKLLKLVGLDVTKYNVYGEGKEKKVSETNHIASYKEGYAYRQIVSKISTEFGKEVDNNRFDNMISVSLIDEKLEEVKSRFPLMHYMFENIVNTSDYHFRDYREDRDGYKAQGTMITNFSELLDLELAKLGTEPETKRRGRPKGSKNKIK